MKQKTLKTLTLAAALALGGAFLAIGPAVAHGPGEQGSHGGYGMRGHMGHMGHMGSGMGHMGSGMGHMGSGRGHMGSGMTGHGAGGHGDCPYNKVAFNKELTVESVTKFLEQRLSHMGNDRLKVGEVKAKDDDTIIAEIVTVDDSLVQRIEFDRRTGGHRQVR